MARNFNWIDNDIGQARADDLCEFLGIKYTPFIKAVFTMMTGACRAVA